MSKIVIALGGNALGNTPEEQLKLLKNVAKIIVELVKEDNKIVLTHGNGPQVGQIFLSMNQENEMPFAECGSMSQGYIGYHMQQCIQNEIEKEKIKKECVTLVTQVLVDSKDDAFNNPTKPIGQFYNEEEAKQIQKETDYTFIEDAGRGYRRVVPSPKPKNIIEKEIIKKLFEEGNIVIAAGGGGVPVIKENEIEQLKGVDAVIDKDRSAALLAKEIDADILLILTSIDKVYINYNKENQFALNSLTVTEAEKYIKEKQFAEGSMLPKIEACIDFVKNDPNKTAIIGSLEKAKEAIYNSAGTIIKN